MKNRQEKILELLDTSGARLHALLARLTLCEDTAGDLMQELFLRLANSRGFMKADHPFAYAYRTAINLGLEWRRKTKTPLHSLDGDLLPEKRSSSPLVQMVQAEELALVLDTIPRLNRLAQEVIVMHYIEQESYETIAERLGKKPQHIRSISAKAMARLRQLLTGVANLSANK